MNAAVSAAERPARSGEWLLKTWETEDGLPENSATAMVQTAEGYLWFGTFRGLVRFDGGEVHRL
jgi:ligand-binding sensor domain-containing protein